MVGCLGDRDFVASSTAAYVADAGADAGAGTGTGACAGAGCSMQKIPSSEPPDINDTRYLLPG